MVATIKKKEGKTVVNDNLLIAAIKDLSLRVLLEKKFSGSNQVVTLSDEYIAFPLNFLPKIQKAVIKSGMKKFLPSQRPIRRSHPNPVHRLLFVLSIWRLRLCF